jgi:hypothetical protein
MPILLGGQFVASLSDTAKNAGNDAICALLNGGKLILGTTGMATTLAEMTFADPAFEDSVLGVANAYPLIEDFDANNSGTAVEFQMKTSAGVLICSGTVGTVGSGKDIELTSTTIVSGDPVAITWVTMGLS